MSQRPITALLIRTHGDYHLGQVLYTGKTSSSRTSRGSRLVHSESDSASIRR